MHLVSIAMVAGLSMGGLLSALFCAALLLRRRRIQTLMRNALSWRLQAHFRVIYEEPPAEIEKQATVLLRLMDGFLISV